MCAHPGTTSTTKPSPSVKRGHHRPRPDLHEGVRVICRSRLNLLRSLSWPHRSNNQNIRFRVAAAINSRLLYGLETMYLAMNNLINAFSPIYNRYIRIVSKLLPSTPADAAWCLPFRSFVKVIICTIAAAIAERTAELASW